MSYKPTLRITKSFLKGATPSEGVTYDGDGNATSHGGSGAPVIYCNIHKAPIIDTILDALTGNNDKAEGQEGERLNAGQ